MGARPTPWHPGRSKGGSEPFGDCPTEVSPSCHAFGLNGSSLRIPKRAQDLAEVSPPGDARCAVLSSIVGKKMLICSIVFAAQDGLLPTGLRLLVRGVLHREHHGLHELADCTAVHSSLETPVERGAVLLGGNRLSSGNGQDA